jgi:hypothetical protein
MLLKVRFIAWHETEGGKSPDWGHMSMMDCAEGIALEYGWIGPKVGNVQGLSADFQPVPMHESAENKKPLFVVGMDDKSQISWQLSKPKGKTETRRFNWLFFLDVRITPEEMRQLEIKAGCRTESGNYVYQKEHFTNDHDARCLTALEDLAKMRNMNLGIGTAFELLSTFARLVYESAGPTMTVYKIAVENYDGLYTETAAIAAQYRNQ